MRLGGNVVEFVRNLQTTTNNIRMVHHMEELGVEQE